MRWEQQYINFLMDGSQYYDFELTTEAAPVYNSYLWDDGAVIDINVCSGLTSSIRWSGATVSNFDLEFITTTGLDNYFIDLPNAYDNGVIDRSIISRFYDTDYFELHPVSGWTTELSYNMNFDNNCLLKLDGGFLQGFFKLHGYPYELLPTRMRKGWTVDMIVKYPNQTTNTGTTLNDVFPNNSGFIFYIGTRGEDKYWNGFTTGNTGEEAILLNWSGLTITDERYVNYTGTTSTLYTHGDDFVTSGGTSYSGYYHFVNHKPYAERDMDDVTTPLFVKYPYKSITDNTLGIRIRPDGRIGFRSLKIGNICQTGTTVTIVNGVTGTTTPTYKIEEGYSPSPIWTANDTGYTNITIVFERYIELMNDCDVKYNDYRKGTLTFYVNARPVYKVENFEEIIPHELDREKELQSGVPFNISWGGGTQGLLESVTFGGIDTSDRNLMLQSLFAGTWMGSLRSFKMYIKPLYVPQIIHNFELRKDTYGMQGDFGGRYIFITKG